MTDYTALSDDELLGLARDGDRFAYGELYARHQEDGRRYARRMVGAAADDVLSEAFTKVLGAIHRGHGPVDGFRLYLFTAIRGVAQRSGSQIARLVPMADLDGDHDDDVRLDEMIDSVDGPDRALVLEAFGRLSKSQQEVLWIVDAEQRPPAELVDRFGLSPNAISARAYRARQAFRRAFLELHFDASGPEVRRGCKTVRASLERYLRDALPEAERLEVEAHLDTCGRCRALLEQVGALTQQYGAGAPLAAIVAMALAAGDHEVGAPVAVGHGSEHGPSPSKREVVAAGAALALVLGAVVFAAVAIGHRAADDPVDQASSGGGAAGGSVETPVPAETTTTSAVPPDGGPQGRGAEGGPVAESPPTSPASTTSPTSPSSPSGSPAAPRSTSFQSGSEPTPAVPVTAGPERPTLAPVVRTPSITPVGVVVRHEQAFVLARATANTTGPLTVTASASGGSIRSIETLDGPCGDDGPSPCLVQARAGEVIDVLVEVAAGEAPIDLRVSWVPADVRLASRVDAATTVVPASSGRAPDRVALSGSEAVVAASSAVECPSRPTCSADDALEAVDVDGDASTATSSSATVAVDPTATVLWAELYWSADLAPDPAGSPAPLPGARGTVGLRGPDGERTSVEADEVRERGSTYQAMADVTDLVTSGGTYVVSDLQVGGGVGAWGAWTLVVVMAPTGGSAGREAAAPLVVSSPFEAATSGSSLDLDLDLSPAVMGAAGQATVDLVAYGATEESRGLVEWSGDGSSRRLGGQSGATGMVTPRLDYERFVGEVSGYGDLAVRSDGEAVVGVVVTQMQIGR